jgi:hypothetical protein
MRSQFAHAAARLLHDEQGSILAVTAITLGLLVVLVVPGVLVFGSGAKLKFTRSIEALVQVTSGAPSTR